MLYQLSLHGENQMRGGEVEKERHPSLEIGKAQSLDDHAYSVVFVLTGDSIVRSRVSPPPIWSYPPFAES